MNKSIPYAHRPWPYPAHHDQPKYTAMGGSFNSYYGRNMMLTPHNNFRRQGDGSSNIIVLDEDNEEKNGRFKKIKIKKKKI